MDRPPPEAYRLLVVLARAAVKVLPLPGRVGDLVVETSKFHSDPDGIGWLVAHGEAAYRADNTGPTREVWDVVPLRGLPEHCREKGFQRWENAEFAAVPVEFLKRAGISRPVAEDPPEDPRGG